MKNTVILKGNRYGISIVLNEEVEFSKLLKDLSAKLEGAEEFFDSDKQLAVTFEGRNLSNEELDQILAVIQSNSKLNIQYVMDENSEVEATFFDILQLAEETKDEIETLTEDNNEDFKTSAFPEATNNMFTTGKKSEADSKEDNTGMFYKGTLRSGQTLEAKDSVIIIGDVNPGASVTAGGNIIIIGALKGSVTAGVNGNISAFVMALSMNPIQIQIADIVSRAANSKKVRKLKQEAMIATVINEQICIKAVSKTEIQDMSF